MSYIIMLEEGVYSAPWEGDPGRTLDKDNAQVYATHEGAKLRLLKDKRYRDFKDSEIIDIGGKK